MSFFEIAKENYDIIAVVTASFLALVLHAAHLLPEHFILPLILFLLALHVLHDLRSEVKHDQEVKVINEQIGLISERIEPKEVTLIKPSELLHHTKKMAHKNRGEIWWFNICMGMFQSDAAFDSVFKPAIENKNTTRIVPVLKKGYSELWNKEVLPKIAKCSGGDKVVEPVWADIHEHIAFIVIDLENGKHEADISVWGEPFMAEYMDAESEKPQGVPRYLIHVGSDSELIFRLRDVFNKFKYKP